MVTKRRRSRTFGRRELSQPPREVDAGRWSCEREEEKGEKGGVTRSDRGGGTATLAAFVRRYTRPGAPSSHTSLSLTPYLATPRTPRSSNSGQAPNIGRKGRSRYPARVRGEALRVPLGGRARWVMGASSMMLCARRGLSLY